MLSLKKKSHLLTASPLQSKMKMFYLAGGFFCLFFGTCRTLKIVICTFLSFTVVDYKNVMSLLENLLSFGFLLRVINVIKQEAKLCMEAKL